MATFYGPWVATDDFRAVLEATVSNSSATQCTVKLVLKIQSRYAYATSSGRASVTCGSTTRSDSVSYDAGETTTLMTETFTVARGSSKRSVSVSGKVWQLNYSYEYSRGSTASGSVSIPAIAYSAPNAPSSCSASRVSDTQAKVTWTNGSTSTTRPRSSTKVERQTDSGKWAQTASVGSTVQSYTDNGIGANHRYRYRVRAYGSGGYSTYSTSGYIYTTPAAPRSVSAAVTGAGTSVRITVDGSNAPYATEWEVQSQLNGGPWTAVGTYESFPVTTNIGGGTVRVRARSVRGTLASAWTESAAITTITPPLAPTVALSPSGVAPTGTAVTVSWTPNHPDGSDQTQAQVEVTVGSGSPTTADVAGAATTYQLPATATAAPATVAVRVRTHGADEDWGAWSEPVTVTVAEPPSVSITSPGTDGAVVADLPLAVAWTVSDATGVAAQLLEVVGDDGATLHAARLDGSARSYELGASTYLLSNLTDYSLRLTVTGGSTLQSTAERQFSVSFAEPSAPGVDAEIDETDMSVSLTVHAGPSSTEAGEVVPVAEHAPAGTPVPGFTVFGATRQNLWTNPNGAVDGVTVTANSDGSITLGGTSTAHASVSLKSYILRPGSEYTFSIDKVMTGARGAFFEEYNSDGANLGGHYVGGSQNKQLYHTFTLNASAAYAIFGVDVDSGQTVSGTYRIMLNEGATAQPWCHPGLSSVDELAIVVSTTDSADDGTSTPVDLDGHALNSLPDGTRDELRIDGTGAVTLIQRVGVATAPTAAGSWRWETAGDGIASFALPAKSTGTQTDMTELMRCDKLPARKASGEASYAIVGTTQGHAKNPAITSTDTAATVAGGATYLYPLSAPQEVDLPGVTLPSWPDGPAMLWASAPVPTEMRVDYPDVSSLTVQRVNADGSLWTVGDGLADGETVVDPLPPLNTPVDYVITAHTAAGATSELRITETLQALMGAFNFGQAAGTCELAELDPDWKHDVERSGTLYHFADGGEGGGLPVAYGGQDVDATRSMGFTLLDLDQLRRLQELAREYFTCWYRDPYGGRALCSVSWSFSSGVPYGKMDVSASMTETVFEEAW